jgi:hypothetical protein
MCPEWAAAIESMASPRASLAAVARAAILSVSTAVLILRTFRDCCSKTIATDKRATIVAVERDGREMLEEVMKASLGALTKIWRVFDGLKQRRNPGSITKLIERSSPQD